MSSQRYATASRLDDVEARSSLKIALLSSVCDEKTPLRAILGAV